MLVEFIIPTYNRVEPLKCMLRSLTSQTDPDWGAKVMIDKEHDIELLGLVNSFQDKRITCHFMDKRYNDWGHTPREKGKQMSKADYIIMTGDDNYYTPNFVAELRKYVELNPGVALVYWDMIHSHYDYQLFKCILGGGQIDMGAFATRRDIAHSIKLGTDFAADGYFIEDFKRLYPKEKAVKINKVLFVHN